MIHTWIARRIEKEFGTQTEFARRIKVSGPYVNAVCLGMKPPGPRILKALKIERVSVPVFYRCPK